MGKTQSKIVVAIDFGTTYTGFAYLFSEDSDTIFTARHGSYLPDDRVPTVLLLKPDGSFHSFGTDAEDNYAKLMTCNRHRGYKLFREFKMALYTKNEKLNADIDIYDTEGNPMKAMTVFSRILEHLQEIILISISSAKIFTDTDSFRNNITWILTIPAIWSDAARQFMRKAAISAGIDEKCLRLVLEPEAASLLIKEECIKATPSLGVNRLPAKSRYILADLGGGTADFCVHEVLSDENIRECYRPSGGAFGGSNVNNEFIQFLFRLFSAPVVRNFKRSRYYDYLKFQREFESSKKTFDKDTDDFIINIPEALLRCLKDDSSDELQSIL